VAEKELRRVVDPDAADALAKADQRARIAAFGGREVILKRGSFGYSPPPRNRAGLQLRKKSLNAEDAEDTQRTQRQLAAVIARSAVTKQSRCTEAGRRPEIASLRSQ